jgi:hypothetical protein
MTQANVPRPRCANRILIGLAVMTIGVSAIGCKSRLFSFGEDSPVVNENTPPKNMSTGGVAIGDNAQNPATTPVTTDSGASTAPFTPVKGEKKQIQIGRSETFKVEGQSIEVTFDKVLEDSRCPKDVICIWEGQAKLQLTLAIPTSNLRKTVVPTLRAGRPELGQVSVGTVALAIVQLLPEATASGQKADSPVVSVVVGKAP